MTNWRELFLTDILVMPRTPGVPLPDPLSGTFFSGRKPRALCSFLEMLLSALAKSR